LAILAPVNVLWSWRDIDSSYENLSFPIIESDEFFALNSKENSTKYLLDLETNVKGIEFL